MLFRFLCDLLFPPKCLLCQCLLDKNELDLCRQCRSDTEEYPCGYIDSKTKGKTKTGFLDSFTAVWYYENNVRKSILRYKFGGQIALASKFGRMLGMKILNSGPQKYDILSWVPVSSIRKLQRGYDQCEILAHAVGRELGIKPEKTLIKKRNTRAQSGIKNASERKANILGAYRIVSKERLYGKKVLLLDDVYTTGATVNECARVLLEAGAAEVHCAVIACASKNLTRR